MKEFLNLKDNEISKECRFATYVKSPSPELPDLHLVKEQVTLADGSIVPKLNPIYDYQRPYWIVKKGQRNFEQPKEWIDREHVNEFYSSQTDLLYKAAGSLGKSYFRGGMKDLAAQNPYLFGIDIKSTACVKQDYFNKYPDTKTSFSVGVFDTEVDVVHGTNEINIATFSFGDVCFTAVHKDFIKNIANAEEDVFEKTNLYLSDYVKSRNIKPVLKIVESEIEILIETFKIIHECKPDFLAIWNLKFDIGKIVEACERANYPIEYLMSDPSVPNEYKSFKFILGPNQKKTSSGKITPIKPAAQWHTVICPASFYVIDSMCAYRHTRMGEQEKKSYSLDAILGDELKLGKLKFESASHLSGLEWHRFMQTHYPVEYVVYNRFDCIGMELLEAKIKDLQVVLPQFSGSSDFADFKSQPRRKVDALHWFVQSHNKVMGCTSEALVSDYDPMILSRDNWIVMLAPALITKQGIKCIIENPTLNTSVYTHTGDLDVAGSYPNGEIAMNISKETTVRELSSIEGIHESVFRKQNMGISAGHVNAIDYCTTMMGFPTLFELDEMNW